MSVLSEMYMLKVQRRKWMSGRQNLRMQRHGRGTHRDEVIIQSWFGVSGWLLDAASLLQTSPVAAPT